MITCFCGEPMRDDQGECDTCQAFADEAPPVSSAPFGSNGMDDHVHLFVRVFPTDAAADVVKVVKGYTSHELRLMFPYLKQRFPSLWTRSYFAATAGNVSETTIRAYIQAQKGT